MTQTCLDTDAPETYAVPTAVFNTNSLSKLKANVSGFGAILTMDMGRKSEIIADRGTQTDDDFMADVEMKHKMDMEELKTKIDSDEKHIESLTKLTDKLNSEIESLKSRIDEKEAFEKKDAKTIDLLLGIPLKYDKDRVNLDYVHINTEGDLVNRKSDIRPAGEGRLKKYWGTCSTAPSSWMGVLGTGR
ncbi:uncharacterized protein LOC124277129 isoform X3 [Haliotis rubra]|uniref:uncharacterized protein LOC124277129 isoform X3 n=1 Tax=Haliotis rubra TaxID=36100 RepID=UPI001EE4F0D4|nr:uncharacterized protein LOC124277129 isoform X3 [Haliotis rubra]